MNKYTREELITAKFQGLTMGDLAEFVYKNPQIPRDAKVLVERVEDSYFKTTVENTNIITFGWKVLPVKGYEYNMAKEFNEKMSQEVLDRSNGKEWQYERIENPEDYIVELTDDLKEQFIPAWCISKDEDFVYIFNHY